ncbi:MAG: hypothetical protein ACI8QQ_003134, partial [Psychroserpens sp.]
QSAFIIFISFSNERDKRHCSFVKFINTLKRQVASAVNRQVNTITKYYYRDFVKRIEDVLDSK